MAATDSSYKIACPNCGAKFAVSAAQAGRRARCAACAEVFLVPALKKSKPSPPVPEPGSTEPEDAPPIHVGFECRLCSTRMYAEVSQVGQLVKCPDCHAKTEVPPPPPPKKKNIPAALEGEQYELWDVDDQPLPADLRSSEPKYITFQCRVCATLLHANELQVGQQIACPDCHTKQPVPPMPRKATQPSVLATDRDTPIIDAATVPGDRPAFVSSGYRMLHEERAEKEYAAALEKSQRTGKPMEIDIHGRPIMPQWPLITGVLPFLFNGGVVIRWLVVSAAFAGAGSIFLFGMSLAMSGGMGAVAGMCFFAIGCVSAMLCFAYAASVSTAIITESAEGNRNVENWPTLFDSFGNGLMFGISGMMSILPGWAMSFIPPIHANLHLTAITIFASVAIIWPIMILSQLHIDSMFGVLSPKILASLARCPFSWALFYFETFALLALCGATIVFFAGDNPQNVIWFTPLFVAVMILISRLLGRLAWYLSEKITTIEAVADDPIPAMKNYNPPRSPKKST